MAFAAPIGLRTVLDQITLCISGGEWVSMVGRNGSGKSTLGKVCTGLSAISRGSIHMAMSDGTAWRTQLVFQNPNAQLVGETVWEDVMFSAAQLPLGDAQRRRDCAEHALEAVGLMQMRDRPVVELSLGQRQLLCVASALATQPDLIVFDEATSMLDGAYQVAVLDAASQFQQAGGTVIWITHRMAELVRGHRVVALDHGRLVFDGTAVAFFYGTSTGGDAVERPTTPQSVNSTSVTSPCRQLGLEPPFAVQVVEQLHARGVHPEARPLTPDALLREVFHT